MCYLNRENTRRIDTLEDIEDALRLLRMIKNFVADAEEAGVSRRQIADMVNEKADNYLTLYGV
jgi:uncharacterized NAD(P)/FAD-binding protein YdhS